MGRMVGPSTQYLCMLLMVYHVDIQWIASGVCPWLPSLPLKRDAVSNAIHTMYYNVGLPFFLSDTGVTMVLRGTQTTVETTICVHNHFVVIPEASIYYILTDYVHYNEILTSHMSYNAISRRCDLLADFPMLMPVCLLLMPFRLTNQRPGNNALPFFYSILIRFDSIGGTGESWCPTK